MWEAHGGTSFSKNQPHEFSSGVHLFLTSGRSAARHCAGRSRSQSPGIWTWAFGFGERLSHCPGPVGSSSQRKSSLKSSTNQGPFFGRRTHQPLRFVHQCTAQKRRVGSTATEASEIRYCCCHQLSQWVRRSSCHEPNRFPTKKSSVNYHVSKLTINLQQKMHKHVVSKLTHLDTLQIQIDSIVLICMTWTEQTPLS